MSLLSQTFFISDGLLWYFGLSVTKTGLKLTVFLSGFPRGASCYILLITLTLLGEKSEQITVSG